MMKIPVQPIITKETIASGCELYLLREDLRGEQEGGNKYFKLRYNLEMAARSGFDTILSFGGVYSNHIAALAAAGKRCGLKTIGVIRGDEQVETGTIQKAQEDGMRIHYVSREQYREKNSGEMILQLKKLFGDFYLVPEGGSNALGVEGCKEIVRDITIDFDVVAVPGGTGATAAGILLSLKENHHLLAFQVLKGKGMIDRNIRSLTRSEVTMASYTVVEDYHFGGYAKITDELSTFIKEFYRIHSVKLDTVYTGKMMYGIIDMMRIGGLKNCTVIAVHTGGLQGVESSFFDTVNH
jgi:1-aminocyclopropane-1-carboxylate deaminase